MRLSLGVARVSDMDVAFFILDLDPRKQQGTYGGVGVLRYHIGKYSVVLVLLEFRVCLCISCEGVCFVVVDVDCS